MARQRLINSDNEAQFSDPFDLRINFGEQLCPANKYWRNVPRFVIPEKDITLFDEDKVKLDILSPGEKEIFDIDDEEDDKDIFIH